MNIKVYDKILDLVGRDGASIVGSRVREILGCKPQLNSFNKRIRQAKNHGMTRLEISLSQTLLPSGNAFKVPVRITLPETPYGVSD